jgi:predicted outer membrane repeat protein
MRGYMFMVILLGGTVFLSNTSAAGALMPSDLEPIQSSIDADLNAVFFVDLSTGWAVSWDGHILMTEDGGVNWQLQYQHEQQLIDIHFINSATGWIAGHNGTVLNTVDGGLSWQSKGAFPYSDDFFAVHFHDINRGWVAGRNGNGMIAKTEDGGVTWTTVGIYDAEMIWDVYFIDEQLGWAVGNEDDDEGIILHSSDGGASWVVQKRDIRNMHGAVHLHTVFFTSPSTGWAFGYHGIILKTSDGGTNWVVQTSDMHNNFNSSFFVNDTTGWAVGNWGRIFFTDDGGQNWVRQESGLNEDLWASCLASVFFVDDTTGWSVGREGTVIHTKDGGQEWIVLHTTLPPSVDLYVSPTGDNANSGLSPDQPLRLLFSAARNIVTDSLNPATIHLAAGRYAPSTNGEIFPIRSTTNTELSYVTIKGPPGGGAILDAEGSDRIFEISFEEDVVLENLVLTGGYHWGAGGAIHCFSSDLTLSHVTISHNVSEKEGGAVQCGACTLIVDHSILFYNSPEEISIYPPDWPSFSTLWISYSDIEGGLEGIRTNDNGTVHWNEGNMEAAPLFCDPDGGDFSLGSDSPCLGAGEDGTNMGALGMGCDSGYVAVQSREGVPRSFGLFQNYPNPFNAGTMIKIDIAEAGPVRLLVYDILGREVARLVDAPMEAGRYELAWDGGELPSGIYIARLHCSYAGQARLEVAGYSKSIKMVMLK